MKKIITVLALVAVGATAAYAGPIEDRQAIMKQMAGPMKIAVGISRDTANYDAAAAKKAMDEIVANTEKFQNLFPKGTEPGNGIKTQATAAIWSDAAGFKAANAKFIADAKAAGAAKDQQAFAAAFKTLQGDCTACHKVYRGAAQ
jgi:cytochrome c556